MEKIRKGGKVAVIYSPGHGAGWSTWNDHDRRETLCMDARIVQHVINGDNAKACQVAESLFEGHVCVLGGDKLQVKWIDEGTPFEITEYDGFESVTEVEKTDYMIA